MNGLICPSGWFFGQTPKTTPKSLPIGDFASISRAHRVDWQHHFPVSFFKRSAKLPPMINRLLQRWEITTSSGKYFQADILGS
jgi:hypothetical protein